MYFGAKVGLVISLLMSSAARADNIECGCNKVNVDIFSYYTEDLRDENFMEDFPWEVLGVSAIPGKTSCQVAVGLVTEDNPNLDNLPDGEYSHLEYILVDGAWQDFDDFEAAMRAANCMPAAS